MNRREFLVGSGALAAAGAVTAGEAQLPRDPFKGTGGVPLEVGAPCLQAPADYSMGISWKVSGLAKGEVEYADNPQFERSRIAKGGGFGLVPVDIAALQVRLRGLRPATKYYYRTITTPFTDYQNIYNAKLGEPIVSDVHSFTTLGGGARAHFCVINDTHAQWKPFEMAVKKVKELKPSALIWNGDATNTTQDKQTAVQVFLDPPVEDRDYAADIPTFFGSGNHDFRGSWISKKEEVMLPRNPAERWSGHWDLKWNFAQRLGDLALIGMDTGEDKPDGHPKWFGLANFEPYRRQQAEWLKMALGERQIATAKYKVLFCHIPLFAAPDHPDYPHDGVKIDPDDYAYWSRECHDLWAPLLERHKVDLVVTAHRHRFRFDRPEKGRRWAQVVGGGPELGVSHGKPDAGKFPTVIEGFVKGGEFRLRVHDVLNGRIVFDEKIA